MKQRGRRGSPTAAQAVGRGLRRRCPVCGAKGTFESWYARRKRCPSCEYPTMRVKDQWIGAYGMNIIASFTVLVLSIAVGFAVTYPHPPVGVLTAVCMLVAIAFPVLFQPIAWSLWSGIDVAMRPPTASDHCPAVPRRATRTSSRSALDPALLDLDLRVWDPQGTSAVAKTTMATEEASPAIASGRAAAGRRDARIPWNAARPTDATTNTSLMPRSRP